MVLSCGKQFEPLSQGFEAFNLKCIKCPTYACNLSLLLPLVTRTLVTRNPNPNRFFCASDEELATFADQLADVDVAAAPYDVLRDAAGELPYHTGQPGKCRLMHMTCASWQGTGVYAVGSDAGCGSCGSCQAQAYS